MKKNKITKFIGFILLELTFLLLGSNALSQGFSLNDSTITFCNIAGKVLTKSEVIKIVQSSFGMEKFIDSNGKKIIKLIPTTINETEKANIEKAKYRSNLVGKSFRYHSFKDINGKTLNFNNLHESVIVLNFWFTSCEPCIREMPFLNSLVEKYQGKKIYFFAPTFENLPKVKNFLKKVNFKYDILPDSKKLIKLLNVISYPLDVIINKKGVVTDVIIGNNDKLTEQQLEKSIRKAFSN